MSISGYKAKINLWKIAVLATLIIAYFLFICLLLDLNNAPDSYKCLWILPICYCVGSTPLFFSKQVKSGSLVFMVFVIGFFVKLVITPLFFALGGYVSFYSYGLVSEHMFEACCFLGLEFILVVAVLLFSGVLGSKNNGGAKLNDNGGCGFLSILLSVLVVFLIFAYFYVPEIQTVYYPVWKTKFSSLADIAWDNETIVNRGTLNRYIYSLFMFILPIVRCLLPVHLIRMIRNRFGTAALGLVLCSVCLLIPFFLLGGDNLAPFLCVIFSILSIRKLYGQKSNLLVIVLLFLVAMPVIVIIVSKTVILGAWRGGTGFSAVAHFIYSYFPGFDNVSLAMGIKETSKLENFFFDFYDAIPFGGTLFGLSGRSLNDDFATYALTNGMIVEWGSGVGYYFTYLLSPFITGFFLVFLVKREQIARQKRNFWGYFINVFFALFSAASIIVYSTGIYYRFLFNLFIPVFLILSVSGNLVKDRRVFYGENKRVI